MIKTVVVRPSATRALIEEIKKKQNVETGGILCGYYHEGQLIIEAVSGPGLKASHSIDEFVIDKEHMAEFLDDEYAKSGGINIYVGEWHTHPQVYPEPSPQDWVSIYERSHEWQHGEIVFLIIGFLNFTPTKLQDQSICVCYDIIDEQPWQLSVEYQST